MAWFECTGGSGGGGGLTLPTIVSVQSVNGASSTVMSYTFTESGTFQVYGLVKYGDTVLSAPILNLNGTAITVSSYTDGTYYSINYAEITVSADDVLTCVPAATQTHSGRQLVVLKGANFSPFTLIGRAPNDGPTYNITGADISLEVYNMGYWQGRNNYRYHMLAGENISVPITGGSDFYYGGSYAIKLL